MVEPIPYGKLRVGDFFHFFARGWCCLFRKGAGNDLCVMVRGNTRGGGDQCGRTADDTVVVPVELGFEYAVGVLAVAIQKGNFYAQAGYLLIADHEEKLVPLAAASDIARTIGTAPLMDVLELTITYRDKPLLPSKNKDRLSEI